MPFRKLFRSRWSALLWAAGICWTAYDVADAGAPPKPAPADKAAVDATGQAIADADLRVLANAY